MNRPSKRTPPRKKPLCSKCRVRIATWYPLKKEPETFASGISPRLPEAKLYTWSKGLCKHCASWDKPHYILDNVPGSRKTIPRKCACGKSFRTWVYETAELPPKYLCRDCADRMEHDCEKCGMPGAWIEYACAWFCEKCIYGDDD